MSTTSPSEGLWSPRHRLLTSGLVLTVTLVAFEALAVVTVMPIVADELDGIGLYGWAFSSFFLGSLLGIVIVGGLIDRGGLLRPYLAGLAVFAIGLIACGFAPTMELLVGGRFLQGIGAGAIPPVAYVCIGRVLPERLRPRMFATLSTAWVIPGIAGPAVGALIASVAGWRYVFLGLLPLVLLAVALTAPAIIRNVPDAPAEEHVAASGARRRLLPAIAVSVGAGAMLFGLSSREPVLGVVALGVGIGLALPAFRALTPEGTLTARHGLPAAVLLRGTLTFAFFCGDAFVPFALQEWRGIDPTLSGLAVTAAAVAWTAGAWTQASRFGRVGARRFVGSGFAVLAFGTIAFALVLSPAVPILVGVVAWGIAGFGMGLSYAPLSLTVLSESGAAEQGTATAGLQLSDTLGTALGTGVGGAIIAAGAAAGQPTWVGLLGAFAVGAAVAAVGSLLARRLPGPRIPRPGGNVGAGRDSPSTPTA